MDFENGSQDLKNNLSLLADKIIVNNKKSGKYLCVFNWVPPVLKILFDQFFH